MGIDPSGSPSTWSASPTSLTSDFGADETLTVMRSVNSEIRVAYLRVHDGAYDQAKQDEITADALSIEVMP